MGQWLSSRYFSDYTKAHVLRYFKTLLFVSPVMAYPQNLSIVIALLMAPFFSFAQEERLSLPKKNEVGVSLVSVQASYWGDYNIDHYISFINGIRYRRLFGQHALKVSGENLNSWSASHGDFIAEGRYRAGKFGLGYQYTCKGKKFKPYLSTDLVYVISKLNSQFMGGYLDVYVERDLDIHGIGYAPAVGLYFEIVPSCYISWEANAEFIWFTEIGTIVRSEGNQIQNQITIPVNVTDLQWTLNPFKSISLTYAF